MTTESKFWPIAASFFFAATVQLVGQTNVTGVVVDNDGRPIRNVACQIVGFPTFGGSRIHYSGFSRVYFTDDNGRFEILLPRADPLDDLQFDHGEYAPAFFYDVKPSVSQIRIVMTKGKWLRGQIVDRQGVPIGNAEVELQMSQEDFWYQRKNYTDRNGVFQFRISVPPKRHSWELFYAGKRFKINYDQVTPETTLELMVDVKMVLRKTTE